MIFKQFLVIGKKSHYNVSSGLIGIYAMEIIFGKILNSLGIILLLSAIWYVFNKIVTKHVSEIEQHKGKTFKTFLLISQSVVKWAFLFIGTVSILNHLLDISPLIYGLSFLGLAASMGSQTLIKDVINGLLNLIEGNIVVGDKITVGNFSGCVEDISLRSLVLRHFNGEIQTIPFSEVTTIKNHSRDYAVTILEIILKVEASSKDFENILENAWKNLDENIKSMAKTPPLIERVLIDERGVNIRVCIKTKPDPKSIFSNAFHKNMWEEMVKTPIALAEWVR